VTHDLDRLTPAVRKAIERTEREMTDNMDDRSESAFATFVVDGRAHSAYFVVRECGDGRKRFVFHLFTG
jgi:ClpP class serine protease